MTTVKKFKINDIVKINEEDIHDSADYDFMMQYAGQDLSIVNEKLVDGYDLWHYTCKDGNGDIIMYNAYNAEPVPFTFIDADLKDATLAKIEENKENTIQEIIQNHILGEIFSEFPTDLDTNAFDFFLRAGVDCAEDVASSPLGEEWGFEVCEQYSFENIRSLRGLMQSMLDDLLRLQDKIAKLQFNPNAEIEFHEVRADRTLHGLKSGLAYYNYEGTHFRVFKSFEDGLNWLDNGDDSLVIADFENDEEFDTFLENFNLRTNNCNIIPTKCTEV